ncbi:MAG TPA: glutamyl-tRNA amidotransferase [Lentisphaeria bacterium]|jgi:uncharacterized protein YqeY|nr:glutamyl-tRNA amidotransferase [Lentisphaeria bacterium]
MSLADQVNADLKQAMRDKDQVKLASIRALRGEIIKFNKSGADQEISDADVTGFIKRLIKQRQDSITMFSEAGRTELAEKEQAQIDVLQAYLPAALSEDELAALVAQAVSETGATSQRDMGGVMKALKGLVAASGKDADNRVVAALVKSTLAAL